VFLTIYPPLIFITLWVKNLKAALMAIYMGNEYT
jgi:hypothetical protein